MQIVLISYYYQTYSYTNVAVWMQYSNFCTHLYYFKYKGLPADVLLSQCCLLKKSFVAI